MRARFSTRSVSPRTSPSASESNTVVMPAGGDLGVVRHYRGQARPLDARARREVLLHVVGVQLDQTRHEVVALEVDGIRNLRPAVGDFGYKAVAHDDRAVELRNRQ